jgi:hypothetical protein
MAATTLLSDNGVTSGITGYQLTGGNDGTLQLQTTTAGGTATTAMTINTSQNVGIGTTSPASYAGYTTLALNNATTGGVYDIMTNGTRVASFFSSDVTTTLASITSIPLAFRTGNTERMRIDTSGNVGIGITPNSWASSIALQMTGPSLWGSSGVSHLTTNTYFDGSNYKYIASNYVTDYYQLNGTHVWRYAASGTAGANVTLTEAMRIDSSGNVGIGATSPGAKLDVRGVIKAVGTDATNELLVANANGGFVNYSAVALQRDSVNMGKVDADYFSGMRFYVTNGAGAAATERARIDTSGNLLVGTTSSVNGRLQVKNSDGTWLTGISLIEQGTNNYWGSAIYPVTHDYYIGYNGANKGYFQSSGGSYVAVSDERLKKDIQDLPYGLSEILSLRPTSYRMTEQEGVEPKSLGFIAQEAMEVLPETVFEMQGGMYGMDKSAIIPVLVKAIQEQQALITTLTERITALEAK